MKNNIVRRIFEETNYGYAVIMLPMPLFMISFNPLYGIVVWALYALTVVIIAER